MTPAYDFPLRMTAEEYLAFDAAAPEGEKYEFFDGLVVPRHGYDQTGTVAMAGASPDHGQLTLNIAVALAPEARRRGCRMATSDQRVRSSNQSYVYPDVVLVCGEPVYSDDNPAVLENPSLLVEVASRSTYRVDRGQKLERYTQLPGLTEYWVVEQNVVEVTQFVRTGDGWQIRFTAGLDATVRCETLGLDVPLADVYALVAVGEAHPYGTPRR